MAIDSRPPVTLYPQGIVNVPLEIGPTAVQRRGALYRDNRRTKVGGVYYGPFAVFSFNCSLNQTPRERVDGTGSPQLYLYMRAGDEWRLWTTKCGDEYMRRFAAQVGWRGGVHSQAALNSMGAGLRGAVINVQTGGRAQEEATAQRQRETKAAEDEASKGAGGGTGGGAALAGLPTWALPAGIGAGVLALAWYRRG